MLNSWKKIYKRLNKTKNELKLFITQNTLNNRKIYKKFKKLLF